MKKILLTIIVLFAILGVIYLVNSREITTNKEEQATKEKEIITKNNTTSEFIQCLANENVIIYGSYTCPACRQLVENLGGYEAINSIYIECNEEWERCSQEMQTNYVPEIQIEEVLYTGPRTIEALAEKTNCII